MTSGIAVSFLFADVGVRHCSVLIGELRDFTGPLPVIAQAYLVTAYSMQQKTASLREIPVDCSGVSIQRGTNGILAG